LDDISPFYDPMIAKVITHGKTRDEALNKLHHALAQTEIVGVTTNIGFLTALCRHDDFAHGRVDTGLIERDLTALIGPDEPPIAVVLSAFMALYDPIDVPFAGFSQWGRIAQTVSMKWADQTYEARISYRADQIQIEYAGQIHTLVPTCGGFELDGVPLPFARKIGGHVSCFGPTPYHFQLIDPLDRKSDAGASQTGIQSPMPGLVKQVAVTAGQKVQEGDALLMLEAMKMEHILRAPRDCVIEEVLCNPEQQVQAGDLLIQFVSQDAE
jgi:3-methylcrotonyl-CoA carboxylase alpha subunit